MLSLLPGPTAFLEFKNLYLIGLQVLPWLHNLEVVPVGHNKVVEALQVCLISLKAYLYM